MDGADLKTGGSLTFRLDDVEIMLRDTEIGVNA